MPRISHFYGVDIYMYYNDHAPPHFHALHGEDEILIECDPPKIYTGSLPSKLLKKVLEWAALHPGELTDNWQRARTGQRLQQIPPLP
jgi:hypothetical protein